MFFFLPGKAIFYFQIQPLHPKLGMIASPEACTALYEQACSDLQGAGFHSTQVYLTTWGRNRPKERLERACVLERASRHVWALPGRVFGYRAFVLDQFG